MSFGILENESAKKESKMKPSKEEPFGTFQLWKVHILNLEVSNSCMHRNDRIRETGEYLEFYVNSRIIQLYFVF